MQLIDAIGNIFSHNEIIAIWEKEDEHHDVIVWRGMAWQLPDEYKNIEKWQIVGVIADKITESDQINININDAVKLIPTVDIVPVVLCKDCEMYQTENREHPRCRLTGRHKTADEYCSNGYVGDGE
ncbi:MAG: hypothetical protein J6K99_07170 [Peptococcaceae bacterium]|nr:hypothetical protein [Peptococcaceae bacterium]